MQTQKSTLKIIQILEQKYGLTEPFLHHKNDFEFLIAVILSAQTTDLMVNKVTPDLFAKFPTANKMKIASIDEIEGIIRRVNFHKTKAKNIKETARIIDEEFGGKVPNKMEDLLKLKGVGRKVANVVMAESFREAEGIVVDTHIKRVSFRLGWTKFTDPAKVELDLIKFFPKEAYYETPKHLILIGRNYCFANKKPDCKNCPLSNICEKHGVE